MKPIVLSTLAAALLAAACQTVPPPHSQALHEAAASVALLRADPEAARVAPAQVGDAEAALRRAQNAWEAGRDEADTAHLAYLAVKRAELARSVAGARIADARAEQAGNEHRRLLAERKAQVASAEAARAAEIARQEEARARAGTVALERQLELIGGRPTGRGMLVALPDALFDPGQARLRGAAAHIGERLAAVLREHPERRVRIEAATDGAGSPASSPDLSHRRAEAVRQALVERGVAVDRIEVGGRPATAPLAGYAPAAGLQNRRVEILFSDARGQFRSR